MKTQIALSSIYEMLKERQYRKADVVDKIIAFTMAVAPLLQQYRGLYKNMGYTVLMAVMPFMLLKLIFSFQKNRVNKRCVTAIVPFIIFQLYTFVAHTSGFSRLLYLAFVIVLFLCVACGTVHIPEFIKYSITICKLGSIAVIIQTLSFYLLHYHIRMIPVNLLLPGSDIWINRSIYGLAKAGDMYRPSGFFLEPSHMMLYFLPLLCLYLIMPGITKERQKTAMLISFGLVISTSGMGIGVVAGVWAIYYVLYHNNYSRKVLKKLFSLRTIIIAVVAILAVVLAYMFIPIVRSALDRIIGDGESSEAIDGRVRLAKELVSEMTGRDYWLGIGNDREGIDFNLSGYHATAYKWGMIGVILSYWYYVQGLVKLKGAFFWFTAFILAISYFSAHTHGTFYMLYYTIFLIYGYDVSYRKTITVVNE